MRRFQKEKRVSSLSNSRFQRNFFLCAVAFCRHARRRVLHQFQRPRPINLCQRFAATFDFLNINNLTTPFAFTLILTQFPQRHRSAYSAFLARRQWPLDRSSSIELSHDDGPRCALRPSRRFAVRAVLSSRLLSAAAVANWLRLGILLFNKISFINVCQPGGKLIGRLLLRIATMKSNSQVRNSNAPKRSELLPPRLSRKLRLLEVSFGRQRATSRNKTCMSHHTICLLCTAQHMRIECMPCPLSPTMRKPTRCRLNAPCPSTVCEQPNFLEDVHQWWRL